MARELAVSPEEQHPLRPRPGPDDLLVRVASSRPTMAEPSLWSEEGLDRRAVGLALLSGLETGALLLVIGLGLVTAWVRRDRWSVRLSGVLGAYLAYVVNATQFVMKLRAARRANRPAWPISPA